MRYLGLAFLGLALAGCGRVKDVGAGKYQVADHEYSSQNYVMERELASGGALGEWHSVNRCLMMEMAGKWRQEGGELILDYARMRSRSTCNDSMPSWSQDSTRLTIPIRNVDGASFESLLSASGEQKERWIKWVRSD